MNRSILSTAAVASAALAVVLGPLPSASADPKPLDDGLQTSVCDNGRTYVFPVVNHAADGAASYQHRAVQVPGSTVVLQSVSFAGTVSIEVDGSVVDAFPVTTTNPRRAVPSRTTTCSSSYRVTVGPGQVVHVEGTDVFLVSGR